jgi:hypothetical protein
MKRLFYPFHAFFVLFCHRGASKLSMIRSLLAMKRAPPTLLISLDESQAMITLTLREIPPYLQKGELFRTFLENMGDDPGETLPIPHQYYKETSLVRSSLDLVCLLNTTRFWLLPDLPSCVYELVLSEKSNISLTTLSPFLRDFPMLKTLMKLRTMNQLLWIKEAARLGDLQVMKFLRRRGHSWGKPCACEEALKNNQLDCLRYAQEHGCPVSYVVEEGHFRTHKAGACLEYVLDNAARFDLLTPSIHMLGLVAIKLRSVPSIVKLQQQSWDLMAAFRAYYCSLDGRYHSVDSRIIARDLLCFLHRCSPGITIPEEVVIATVRRNDLACLAYLCEHWPGAVTITCVQAAARKHSAECLAYLYNQGCPWDERVAACAVQTRSVTCLRFYHDQMKPHEFATLAWVKVWQAAQRSNSKAMREWCAQQAYRNRMNAVT